MTKKKKKILSQNATFGVVTCEIVGATARAGNRSKGRSLGRVKCRRDRDGQIRSRSCRVQVKVIDQLVRVHGLDSSQRRLGWRFWRRLGDILWWRLRLCLRLFDLIDQYLLKKNFFFDAFFTEGTRTSEL